MRPKWMRWCVFQKPNLWKKTGRFQRKRLLMIPLEQKPLVRSRKQIPLVWFNESANKSMKPFFISYVQGTLLHQRRSLATWRPSLLSLGRWPGLRLKTPTLLRFQILWGLHYLFLLTLERNFPLRTTTPMCTTSSMVPPTKVHHWSWQKNWFDLETLLCIRIWQNVDTRPMDFIQQENKLQRLFRFPTASCRKILKIGKGTLPVLFVASIVDVINTSTRWLVAMKRFNVFVENMVLLEEKENTLWQGLNIPLYVE